MKPRVLTSFGPISRPGAITAAVKIHKETGKIVLTQKMRIWFRVAVCLWAIVVLMTPFMIYSELFSSQTTRFTCDRGTGECAVDGRSREVPRLADIRRAEMDHDFNRRDGRNWGINLITQDGKKHSIEQQRAIKDSVVSDYRAAATAINAFLAHPAQQKLDVSFTYRAGLSEQLQSIFYFFFGAGTLFVGWLLWTKRLYTFEPGKVIIEVRRWFQHDAQEITADRITAIVERKTSRGRMVELRVDGPSNVAIIETGHSQAATNDPLARELAEVLGKPLESAST